jgi:hypothetical protein
VALSAVITLALSRVLGQHTETRKPTFGFFQAALSANFPYTATVDRPCVNLLPFSAPTVQKSECGDLRKLLAIQEELGK